MRKIRIGVAGHDLKFWLPLQQALEATGLYEFRHDIWQGHEQHERTQSDALIGWADVLVAEWALGNAIYYSTNKRADQRLIVRLHAQERRTDYPSKIAYENVDTLVFVGSHILEECLEKFDIPAKKCVVIGNFVDVERYGLSKTGEAMFTLGMIGALPSSKRMDLALDTLEILLRRDERYQLRIKGAAPPAVPWLWARIAERDYYESLYARINEGPLRYKVIFDPQGNDVQHWLRMVGTILSPSDAESFHMAVVEGAASGALPVLWSWPGAARLYPEFELVESAEAAADRIEFYNHSRAGGRYRKQAPETVRRRYGGHRISEEWGRLLVDHHTGVAARSAAVPRGLIVVWAIDQWQQFHRREMLEALAAHLVESHDVLVIEPGNHFETIKRLGWGTPAELDRMVGGELIMEASNIYRTRLFTRGVPSGLPRARYQGGTDDSLQVLDDLIKNHFPENTGVLHWVYKPDQALRLRKSDRFVYEVYDDYTMDFGTGVVDLVTAEQEPTALQRAEHVFFTSLPLHVRKARMARQASIIGNGVAYNTFARHQVRDEGRPAGRPIAGYLGNLSVFFDWELMLQVCKSRHDMDFVFHGQVELPEGDGRHRVYSEISSLTNVRFTGRVTREMGAAAINRYDVLLIPFVVNEAMHAVNPLKLWEYLATGKPVVYSPMAAIEEVEPLAFVAEGVDEWLAAIKRCLEGDAISEEARVARISKAEAHQWARLTETHAAIIQGLSEC